LPAFDRWNCCCVRIGVYSKRVSEPAQALTVPLVLPPV